MTTFSSERSVPGGFDFVVRHMLVVVGCFTRATIEVLRYTVSWLKRFPNDGGSSEKYWKCSLKVILFCCMILVVVYVGPWDFSSGSLFCLRNSVFWQRSF